MDIQERLQCSSLLEVHQRLMQHHESGQNEKKISKHDELLIEKNHKFLWENSTNELSWEEDLAKKYYDKLFKEYCICDLSKYKENKVALRWRTKNEVILGRGQFFCADKKCNNKEHLKTWEVNFCYIENKEKKNALVKIKLCSDCSAKLNYHSKKREIKRKKRKIKCRNKSNNEKMSDDIVEASTSGIMNKDQSSSSVHLAKETISPWSQNVEVEIKSREEEMDDYLDELIF